MRYHLNYNALRHYIYSPRALHDVHIMRKVYPTFSHHFFSPPGRHSFAGCGRLLAKMNEPLAPNLPILVFVRLMLLFKLYSLQYTPRPQDGTLSLVECNTRASNAQTRKRARCDSSICGCSGFLRGARERFRVLR